MALQVSPQVVQTRVGLGTDLAVVRSDPRVVQHVLLQHAAVGKGFAALRAHVRPLARVHSHVDRHLVGHGEAFAANAALEGPLPRVRESVGAHGPHLGEGLSAVWAHVRLLSRVDPGVAAQSSRGGEALGAVGALVGPLPRVGAHVLLQVVAVPEAAAAHGAALGPVVVVPQLVVGQAFFREEALAAFLTLEGFLVVHPLVIFELADAGEGLVAVPAPEAVVGAVGELVLAHLMVPEQVSHLESLAAVRTLVFGQQLRALVSDTLVQGSELTAALSADVGGVLTLPLPVAGQVSFGPESFPALRALVRLHCRVEPLVFEKLKAVLKAPPTQRTVMGDPCPRIEHFERHLPVGQRHC